MFTATSFVIIKNPNIRPTGKWVNKLYNSDIMNYHSETEGGKVLIHMTKTDFINCIH